MDEIPQDLQDLDERIDILKKQNEGNKPKSALIYEYNQAMRMITEFVAPIFIGLCIGYLLDKLCSTLPIFIIIFAFLGLAAGILNIYKLYIDIDKEKQR